MVTRSWNRSSQDLADDVRRNMSCGLVLSAMICALCSASAVSQDYPTRPIRLVVPQAAGSSTDIVARILAEQLSVHMGQQVLVDPRPGAGGSIGAGIVAKALPDGYTLLMANSATHAVNLGLYRELPYHPVNDFAPVSLVAVGPYVLLAHPSLPVTSVRDLIALARRRPQDLTFASGGNGTGTHLSGEMLKQMTGIKMVHIPYKGSAPGLTDLMAGQVSIMFIGLPPALAQVRSNRVKPLAVTGSTRSQTLPRVPTMIEAGIAGYVVTLWNGVAVPAGTPGPIVQTLNAQVRTAMQLSQVKERLAGLGLEATSTSSQEFSAFIRSEITKWSKVIRDSGATLQ